MRIKMKTNAAGPLGNFKEGEIYEAPLQISLEQASAFVAGGYAVNISPVRVDPVVKPVEVAAIQPTETATAQPQRGRGRPHKSKG